MNKLPTPDIEIEIGTDKEYYRFNNWNEYPEGASILCVTLVELRGIVNPNNNHIMGTIGDMHIDIAVLNGTRFVISCDGYEDVEWIDTSSEI